MRRCLALIRPLDVWSVRDGRSFDAGSQSVGRAASVSPSTIWGAVTAGLLRVHGRGRHPRQVIGPFLVDETPAGLVPYLPTPLDIVSDEPEDRVTRLGWGRAPEAWDLGQVVPSRHGHLSTPVGVGKAAGGWFGAADLRRYLGGDPFFDPPVGPSALVAEGTRVQVDAGERLLARHQVQRFVRDSLCFGAVVTIADDLVPPAEPLLVRFGGEGREAIVRFAETDGDLGPLTSLSAGFGADETEALLYLVTPAAFPGTGWLPPLEHDVEVLAAAVGGPVPVASGRPGKWQLVWCAAPGSVYHLRFRDPTHLQQYAARSAGSLRAGTLKQTHHDMRSAGFGAYVLGRIPS